MNTHQHRRARSERRRKKIYIFHYALYLHFISFSFFFYILQATRTFLRNVFSSSFCSSRNSSSSRASNEIQIFLRRRRMKHTFDCGRFHFETKCACCRLKFCQAAPGQTSFRSRSATFGTKNHPLLRHIGGNLIVSLAGAHV